MKIITTPMCEDILKIAGLKNYQLVKPNEIKDADIAILLSETKSNIPKIPIKLNTYTQVYDSIITLQNKFNTNINEEKIEIIKELIKNNKQKKDKRKNTKVKVYSNFLKDTVEDMGYIINDDDYDFVVMPDYMNTEIEKKENIIKIPSHKNVSEEIIPRLKERYGLLESKLCMQQ